MGSSEEPLRQRFCRGTDCDAGNYGVLLYTASPDADGTLGSLVQQARHIEDHLIQALQAGELCSNDPICAGGMSLARA